MRKPAFFCLTVTFSLLPIRAESVVLISVDTLRADRLGCYGYQWNQTPNIDRWAREGILFERALSEYPLTLPAHSTLLTGTYPFRHGVRENIGYVLPENSVTLAEVFKDNGYTTGAFIGSYVMASRFGMGQGFDTFDEDFGETFPDEVRRTAVHRPAEEVTRRFLEWLGQHSGEKVFAFLHFFDPHTPRPYGYDWEVSRVDQSIGRIHEFLEKTGRLEQTHILLTADHGEGLDEHGESGHGFFLYDSTIRVPLIVRPASSFQGARRQVSSAASLVDVMPTLLDLTKAKVPESVQGRSLVRAMLGRNDPDRGIYAETYIPQLHFDWSPLRCLRLGRYKFIDAPRQELYDLESDPREVVNLLNRNQALANQYRARLLDFVTKYHTGPAPETTVGVDRATRENLAALGYLTLGKAQSRPAFGTGTDPKDRITAFETYHQVLNEIDQGRASEISLERLASLRREAPEMRGLSFLEAQIREKQGDAQQALENFQKALQEDPGNLPAKAGVARTLMRLGRRQEAEETFRELLTEDPGDYRSRNNLAGLYMLRGDSPAAEAELLKAVESAPFYSSGWQNLARVYVHDQRWKEAEAALRRALAVQPQDAGSHFLLYQVLTRLGRAAEAEQERQIAVELDPRLGRL